MLDSKKDIPVIILCNKVDDPEDQELMELVYDVQHKVEEIFHVGNQTKLLDQMLAAACQRTRCENDDSSVYPIFLLLSAGNAFTYCAAANCLIERFHQLDSAIIDKLGQGEVGKTKWKRLSTYKKYKVAYDAISDPAQYQELLATTNFDKFLLALSYSIGGGHVQSDLLEKQTEVSLRNLSLGSSVVPQLRSAYEIFKSLDWDPSRLKQAFWMAYDEQITIAIQSLRNDLNVSKLNGLVDHLVAYRDFASELGWSVEEEVEVVKLMAEFVSRQIKLVLEKEGGWKIGDSVIGRYSTVIRYLSEEPDEMHCTRSLRSDRFGNIESTAYKIESCPWNWIRCWGNKWQNICTKEVKQSKHNPVLGALTWETLTYHDWSTIIGSLQLMASTRHFSERFGRKKMELERLLF